MVYVDIEKCTGCGVCAEACPVGAISLVGGTAQVDQEKCTDHVLSLSKGCEACVEVCPNRAMLAVREPLKERVTVPSVRPAPEIIRGKPRLAPVSLRTRAVPAIEAALAYLGRNIAPHLANYLLHALDRRLGQEQASPAARASGVGGRGPSTGPSSGLGRGSGRGRRRRRRQGRGRR
jgi:ferredoxin